MGRQNMLCQCHIGDITSCQYSLQPRNADAETLNTAVALALVFMLRLSRMLLLHLNATPLLFHFANHKSLPHLPQAPSLLFSADAAGSKTRLQLWLMCSYNMADSDHWVLYHSASRVYSTCPYFRCVRKGQRTIHPHFVVTQHDWTSLHSGEVFLIPAWLIPIWIRSACLPPGGLPNRRGPFLTVGKEKRGADKILTGTGCLGFRGCQPAFCCCLRIE